MAFKLNKKAIDGVRLLVDQVETARASLAERLAEIASEWDDEFGDKSERWQDGDNGQAVREKIDQVREWAEALEEPMEPEIDYDTFTQ